ncbi:MAG: hypothetical protein AB7Y46_00885 [Armatimonadota bacterium]
MHRLHEGRVWKYVALYVAATMVVPYAVVSFPAVAEAQAQPVVESASVAVLPILDVQGSTDSVLSQKATDALALAMEDSREFIVTSKRDLERELAALELTPPLSVAEQVRLGNQLRVDEVASGQIVSLRIDQHSGQATIAMAVGLLNVASGEYLNGANVTVTTKPIPGWQGEEARIINDAVTEVAGEAVSAILMNRIPEGYVTSVNTLGVATVNLGQDDRLRSGMEMLLLRPVWQRSLEKMIMVKVGRYSVSDVAARTATMMPLGEGRARVGDRVYKLYSGPARVRAQERKENNQKTLATLAALGLLFGVVAVASGPSTTDGPVGVTSHLFQQAPGDEAVIRVHVPARNIPLRDQIFAWLFFRSDGQQFFSMTPSNLVGFVDEARLPNGIWDDQAAFGGPFEVEAEFTWLGADGDEEEGTIELLYYHLALQAGHTYYHRVQRVVEPPTRAGSGSPVTTTGLMGPQQVITEPPTMSVDPESALSEGSRPTDGVTYFTPAVLQSPENGAQNQSTRSITFAWNATVGANEYLLQVFPEDDPDGRRNPEFQVQIRRETTGVISQEINFDFAPNSRFFWRVGARRSGEPLPETGRLNQRGWLFSEIRSFSTPIAPPSPPGTAAAGVGGGSEGFYSGPFRIPRYSR